MQTHKQNVDPILDNEEAAISTAADLVRNTIPYDANGFGFTAGIWDGGSVLSTHQEFDGRVDLYSLVGIVWPEAREPGQIPPGGAVRAGPLAASR